MSRTIRKSKRYKTKHLTRRCTENGLSPDIGPGGGALLLLRSTKRKEKRDVPKNPKKNKERLVKGRYR